MPRHRVDQVARRLDVLELDAVDLDAPGVGGLVDRAFPPRPEDDPERVTEADVENLIEQARQKKAKG